VSRLRDIVIGLFVLAAVFVAAQGAVGYFGFPRKSLVFWIVPGLAVLAVVVWYLRPSEDWTGEAGDEKGRHGPGGGEGGG